MGIIKNEDIRGYRVNEEIVCLECFEKDELKDLKESEIITTNEIEEADATYFCDRCKEEM